MTSFRRLALISAVATFLLIALGGLVRATDSGLGCSTDWPGCNGELIPNLARPEVAIEFSHRVVAGIVGLLVAAVAVMAIARLRTDRRLLWPALAAAVLVLFQAALGRYVVVAELEADLVVLHLGTALALLAVLVSLSMRADAAARRSSMDGDERLWRRAVFAAGAVLVLLLVGSYLSGIGEARNAGFPSWPLIDGRLVPDLSSEVIVLHWLHRALAVVVGTIVAVVAFGAIKDSARGSLVARSAHAAVGLFVVEILIGAANVWTQSSPSVNAAFVTAHLTIGAAIWGSLIALAAAASPRTYKVPVAARTPERTAALEARP